ncbi:MAG: hypothetical protein ACYCYK_12260 [Candidatus Dormibacteria bacterium]
MPIPNHLDSVYVWCLLWLALAAGELTGNRALIARPLDAKKLSANTYGRMWGVESWLQRRAEILSRDTTGKKNMLHSARMLLELKQLVDEAAVNYIRFAVCERLRHFADVTIYLQVAAAFATAFAAFVGAPQLAVRYGAVGAAIGLTTLLLLLGGWALFIQSRIQLS